MQRNWAFDGTNFTSPRKVTTAKDGTRAAERHKERRACSGSNLRPICAPTDKRGGYRYHKTGGRSRRHGLGVILNQEFANLVGAWRLLSFGYTFVDTGERVDVFGPNPDGYMVLSHTGRIMFLFGSRDRSTPQNDADRASLFNQMYGYTGLIQAAGPSSFITKVDYAWNPAWGGDQLRHFKLEGDKLLITSREQTVPAHGTRLIVGDVLWVREGS